MMYPLRNNELLIADGGDTSLNTASVTDVQQLAKRYRTVRAFTEYLCEPLEPEDCVIQSMPDVSPTRWHLAHMTWFFETFVLKKFGFGAPVGDSDYAYLFNSYYNAVGPQFPRPRRGLLSRPTMGQVLAYRRQVDERMESLFDRMDDALLAECGWIVELGLQHEQQHQELVLTDIKHVLAQNPLHPVYRELVQSAADKAIPLQWRRYPEGLREIGCNIADGGFCYDNECPRHRVFVHAFELANRPVTCGEYIAFMEDGGYRTASLWLAQGWDIVCDRKWHAPLYWQKRDGQWWQFTLAGFVPVDPASPVCHVSFLEADAFARWAGARLPTEAEWETAAAPCELRGNFADGAALHPQPAVADDASAGLHQIFGDVWECTASPYVAYPGFRPLGGAVGEYNGKFMCNQMVLRGGSCATPPGHARLTYRNFLAPDRRWQFTGIRLARTPD